ncbi:hypothetical protein E2C01_086206 [Portunus trituberculatus]|uniref:Uncharacterized protein n=1 Tax=Portunus trituberculatus TaxID=210409 RepID=A0A5B7JCU1_PORTR|nr:hypothetical protein [Portunus trituberculatus]
MFSIREGENVQLPQTSFRFQSALVGTLSHCQKISAPLHHTCSADMTLTTGFSTLRSLSSSVAFQVQTGHIALSSRGFLWVSPPITVTKESSCREGRVTATPRQGKLTVLLW